MPSASAVVLAVVALVPIVWTAASLVAFPFERQVAFRYLRPLHASRPARIIASGSVAPVVVGLVFLTGPFAGHRDLQTAGVIFVAAGAVTLVVAMLLRNLSLAAAVSIFGIMLGVAALVVVLSVTNGFRREYTDRVLSITPHLTVTPYGSPSADEAEEEAKEIKRKLRGLAGVESMQRFSISAGEVMIGRTAALVKGMEAEAIGRTLKDRMVAGTPDSVARPAACAGNARAGRLLLGVELARRLRVGVGDCLSVMVLRDEFGNVGPASVAFQVRGIFEIGYDLFDRLLAIIPIEDAPLVGDPRRQRFGVEVRFDSPGRALALDRNVLEHLVPDAQSLDWREMNHGVFEALSMQTVVVGLIVGLVIAVGVVNLISTLLAMVVSRRRAIAVLGALGASVGSVRRIFSMAASLIGLAGTGLGFLYALLICVLLRRYGFELDEKVYLIGRLPIEIAPSDVVMVVGVTQALCLAAARHPARRAAKGAIVAGLKP